MRKECGLSSIKDKLVKRKKKEMMDGKGGAGKKVINALGSVLSAPSRAFIAIMARRNQDKMIEDFVNRQPSKLPPWERSFSNVEAESKKLDKDIKKKLKSKGIY